MILFIIENTFKISGWNNELNYGYQLHHIQSNNTEMYPRNLMVNSQIMNVLVSCLEDFALLFDDIKDSLLIDFTFEFYLMTVTFPL